MISPEDLEKRYAILEKLGQPILIGSNKLTLNGIIPIMQLQSNLIATLPETKDVHLASNIEITSANKDSLIYVWMIMNGLSDTLPEFNTHKIDRSNEKKLRKEILLIAEWMDYFNFSSKSKEYNHINKILRELIINTRDVPADKDEKVLMEKRYQIERKKLLNESPEFDQNYFHAYVVLLQKELTISEKLLLEYLSENYNRVLIMLRDKLDENELHNEWMHKLGKGLKETSYRLANSYVREDFNTYARYLMERYPDRHYELVS